MVFWCMGVGGNDCKQAGENISWELVDNVAGECGCLVKGKLVPVDNAAVGNLSMKKCQGGVLMGFGHVTQSIVVGIK